MMSKRLLFISIFFLAIDLIAVQAPITIFGGTSLWYTLFIGSSLILITAVMLSMRKLNTGQHARFGTILISTLFVVQFPKLITAVLLLVEDAWRLMALVLNGLFSISGSNIELLVVRNPVWSVLAVSVALLLTSLFIYGTLFNVYRYRLHEIQVKLLRLPKSFAGLRVVQISDIHSGSLQNHRAVESAVQKINDQNPDLIFFTGDLVNNIADEATSFIDIFSKLRAKHGVYSILGNHDYGDYVAWPDAVTKEANLNKLKHIHAQMGWRLLLNEHVRIEQNGESIAIAGVENWSAKGRFSSYGKLQQALAGLADAATILLLSHDPSHWEAEILDHPAEVDMTLSGHTHGMQFGLEWWKWRWSPVQYLYRQWAGLYNRNHQFLYVNRGFGVIGYPGRVGILPEITVFTLQPANA